MAEKKGIKIAAQNRKAFHDYFVEDRYEAGIFKSYDKINYLYLVMPVRI